jgi:NADPH:quinone reductase-like Zn-dependent oxidoreductase
MKAIVQHGYGSPDRLRLEDIETPAPKANEVLVRVRAASVNPADVAVATGLPRIGRLAYGLRTPKDRVRGMDLAGIVEAVGSAVTDLKPGDEVYGQANGTFAEFAVTPANHLSPKPANLTFEEAAAVPMVGLVAIQAVRDRARVQPGQKVLVNGAGGGIGSFTVMVAKVFGAEVTGVCGPDKVELVRSLGADHVIDYTQDDFTRNAERYDFILDNVSNHSLRSLRRVLTPEGMLICNAGEFDHRWIGPMGRFMRAAIMSVFSSRKLGTFLSLPNRANLLALKELIEAGKVRPVVDRTIPLAEAPAGIAHVAAGHARGKVVVAVAG